MTEEEGWLRGRIAALVCGYGGEVWVLQDHGSAQERSMAGEPRGVESIWREEGLKVPTISRNGWIGRLGVRKLCVEPGSPWENGHIESISGKLRYEPLKREVFDAVMEVRYLTEQYRWECNAIRPHSALGYRPPAEGAIFRLQ